MGWGSKAEAPHRLAVTLSVLKGDQREEKNCNFLYLLSLLHSRLCMTWQQYIDFSGVSFYNYKRKRNY